MSSSVGMMKFPIYGKKTCSKPPTRLLYSRIYSRCNPLHEIPFRSEA
jgi:hypothetical protein